MMRKNIYNDSDTLLRLNRAGINVSKKFNGWSTEQIIKMFSEETKKSIMNNSFKGMYFEDIFSLITNYQPDEWDKQYNILTSDSNYMSNLIAKYDGFYRK